ncbi:claudin-7 isoform X1 [Sorex araneus]|uniref:claudin-7 isoform X1 n=1 Tax=Sorex araneus TaxID=42254 RepID=UPI002433F290|nr:claudin-7 isoform X1 [Sorex araneus]
MANSGLQLLGFSMALLGWVGLLACTAIPQWQMSSFAGDNIITSQAMYKGLWMECAIQSTGVMNCKIYDSVLALPAALQATRALMVVSLVLGFMAMIVATMGMKCTNCGGDDKVKKARIAMTGGIIFIVAGLSLALPSLLAGQGLHWSSWEVACFLAPVPGVRARQDTVHPAPTLNPTLPRSMCELGDTLIPAWQPEGKQSPERTWSRVQPVDRVWSLPITPVPKKCHVQFPGSVGWEIWKRVGCAFLYSNEIKSMFWRFFFPL